MAKTYTVKKGDTLTQIAKKYKTTVSVLAKLNKIVNVNVIHTGQVLKLPETVDYAKVGEQLESCLKDIEKLDSVKRLSSLLKG